MIKSVNQLVTAKCNSKCKNCSIWQSKDFSDEMLPQEFKELYSKQQFREVEDLCISGGEPTMRRDLVQIMNEILPSIPKLNILFLSSNASYPDRVLEFLKKCSDKIKDVYACLSLEGDRQTHKLLRGVDTYNSVVYTLEKIQQLDIPNIHSIISTTLSSENCDKKSLEHIRDIANRTGSTHSFRPVTVNDTFYKNTECGCSSLSIAQAEVMRSYISQYKNDDPFLKILCDFIDNKPTVMGDRKTGIKCLAGDISVLIQPDGKIFPCINSKRQIGDKKQGVYEFEYLLGDKELCPCCTECQVYPMLNFAKYGTRLKSGGKQ